MRREAVSVVVPVHNGERFIRDCWGTLVAQTLRPIEVVFIDDGSTDATPRALRELGADGVEVKVLSRRCLGPAAARNAGLREARGDFVAFLDIDDLWPESKLERAACCFRKRPEVSVVGGLVQLEWLGDDGAPGPEHRAPHRRVNLGAYVFRASLFARHGVLDPTLRYGEDVDYLCRLRQAGVTFLELDEVTLRYRRHAGNMTRGRGPKDLGLFEALSRSLARARRVEPPGEEPKS